MHRVGLDVLVEVGAHRCRESQPLDGGDDQARRHRAGRLVGTEVAQCGRGVATVQGEEVHRVHEGQGDAGHDGHVRAGFVVEAALRQAAGEQRAVQPLRPACPELVVQQLGEGDLCRPAQPRQHERLRVRLLQVVDAALHQELEHLLPRRVPAQVRRQGRPLDHLGHREQTVRNGSLRLQSLLDDVGGPEPQLGQEPVLQGTAQTEEVGVPLPAVVDVVEAGVVQLVGSPQGGVHVVVVEGGAPAVRVADQGHELVHRERSDATQDREERSRQGPARGGESHRRSYPRPDRGMRVGGR